jgi:trigger factor
VGDYHDWQFERRIPVVEASHVEHALQRLHERHAELHTVSGRPVATGDYVLIDYQGFLEGQPLPGLEGHNVSVEVGSGQFVSEIEHGLLGLEAGAEKTIGIDFPEDHHDATVRGKRLEFRVTAVEIKEKVLPELDDEFARAYEDADSLAALRERLRGDLEEAARQQADEVLRRDILAKLVAENTITVPEVLVQEQMRQMYLRQRRQEVGRELHEEEMQVDPESLRPTYGEQALAAVRGQVLVQRIEEDLEVSILPEEIDAEVRAMASRAAQNPEALKQAMERNGSLRAFEAGMRERKMFQAIMNVVQITDVHVDASAAHA